MSTRAFPVNDLLQVIKAYEPVTGEDGTTVYTLVEDGATGETPSRTDNLGEWHFLIFKVDGVAYRCWYIDGNAYWRSESGDAWEGRFTRAPSYDENPERYTLDGDLVVCEAVYKRPVMTYVWAPVDSVGYQEQNAPTGQCTTLPIDAICYVCGKCMSAGGEAMYVVGMGTRHKECVAG